ncbi:hypothetical protein ACTM1J_25840, partial [Citrobacter freundii]
NRVLLTRRMFLQSPGGSSGNPIESLSIMHSGHSVRPATRLSPDMDVYTFSSDRFTRMFDF